MQSVTLTFLYCFLSTLSLGACAVDPDYIRHYPGLKGQVLSGSQPAAHLNLVYGQSVPPGVNPCDYPLASSSTDDRGQFSIAMEKKLQLITLFPLDEGQCTFRGAICIGDRQPWRFEIIGQGEKQYHTGGSLLRQPQRIFFMSSEGRCQAPPWLTIDCNLQRQGEDLCHIIAP